MLERRKLKKENEKIVDVDKGGATGEKEAADDGNDAGVVGNDAGVGTINVPAVASGWGVDEKQGSGKEMKKPGVIGKGGGEVSGGGVGLVASKNSAGDKILLSGTGDSHKKFLLLLLGWVTFQAAFLILTIQNGSNYCLHYRKLFFLKWLLRQEVPLTRRKVRRKKLQRKLLICVWKTRIKSKIKKNKIIKIKIIKVSI